jgi:diguanylate cyclase (GGDEF)-like protein
MISMLFAINLKSLIVFAILNFIVNGGFLILVFRIRRQSLFKCLAYGCFAFSIGWLLFLSRFTYGINLITLPLANLFILLMPITLIFSIAALLKIRVPSEYIFTIIFVLTATFLILAWAMHDQWIPGIYTSILNGFFYLYAGFLLFKYTVSKNPLIWTILLLNLLTFILLALRAAVLTFGWLYPEVVDENLLSRFLVTALLFNIMCINAQVLCFPVINFMETHNDLLIANKKLEELSNKDELTGLLNRRQLKEKLEFEYFKYSQYGIPFSIIICDLDHFKEVNDRLGHLVGDIVLGKVAQLLMSMVRPNDFVLRFGGEEFIILLPESDRLAALQIAERLRNQISKTCFDQLDIPLSLKVTASFGVADITDPESSVNALLQRADLALYEAKRGGRDRVCAA